MKKTLSFMVAMVILLTMVTAGTFSHPAGSSGDQLVFKGSYSSIPLQDEVKSKLQEKGANIAQHLPAHLVKGPHQTNPALVSGTKPIAPEQNAIALYLEFPGDEPPTAVDYEHITVELLEDMLFGISYDPYKIDQFKQYAKYGDITAPTDRTLKNYYMEVSNGNINVIGQVVKVIMPKPYSYYSVGNIYGLAKVQNDYGDYTMAMLFADAISAADAAVDFSQFAINGEVPNVFLIHPGTGAEWNLDPNVIWSHSWQYNEAYCYLQYAETGDTSWLTDPEKVNPDNVLTADGVRINKYSIEPEVGGDITGYEGVVSGPFPPQVGVYAHEFGHVLGIPDQYDYGYDSEGTGAYTIMAAGSWTRYPNAMQYAGNSPVHFDAWSKVYGGLIQPIVLNQEKQTFTLNPAAKGGEIVKLIVPGSNGNEYFLMENRQQINFDFGLSRYGANVKGLAIFHVDENVLSRNFWRPNEAQNWFQSRKQNVKADPSTGETHYGIALVQADNRWDLEQNKNSADAGDLYKTGSELSPTSTPNSGSYYFYDIKGTVSNNTGIYVKDIIENADGSITFTAGVKTK